MSATLEAAPTVWQASTGLGMPGVLGVRLVGGSARERDVIGAQLGLEPAPLRDAPSLTVRIEPLPDGPRRLFGVGEYAAIDQGLVVLRGPRKAPAQLLIPFDGLDVEPTVVAAPGTSPLPLLVPLVNLTALSRDTVALHAAAFERDGLGVLLTGWSKSGKTEALLAMAARGASHIGDEWVYAAADGRLVGLPEPMRLWSWHLRELGDRAPRLRARTRLRLALLDAVCSGGTDLDARLPAAARRLRHTLAGQRSVRVPPEQVLGPSRVGHCTLDLVILLETHAAPNTEILRTNAATVAARVSAMLPTERNDLLAAYRAFRYAFPDRRSELVELAAERERALVAYALGGRPAFVVRHPYPPRFEDLADAVERCIERARSGRR